jgi:oxygen-independent coproporphyrinogen III oxidase
MGMRSHGPITELLRFSVKAGLFRRIQQLYSFDKPRFSRVDIPFFPPKKDPLTVFIHFPFCNAACRDCIFSKTVDRSMAETYLDRLIGEIDLWADLPGVAGREISSIYFGGGTPSLIPMDRLRQIMLRLSSKFPLSPSAQVTLECNPDSLRKESFELLREAGINRISIGIQSLSEPVLREMGRSHSAADSIRLIEAIAAYGKLTFSADLMYGFESQTIGVFLDNIGHLIASGVSHLSLYPLIRADDRSKTSSSGFLSGRQKEMFSKSELVLAEAGFPRYSTEDFARSPEEWNKAQADCWRVPSKDMIALGVAGLGSIGQWHYHKNHKISHYCESVAARRIPIGRSFTTTAGEEQAFRLLLGLKYLSIDRKAFKSAYGTDPVAGNLISLMLLKQCGWLRIDDRVIALTDDGLLFHTEIWSQLLMQALKPRN